MGWITFSLQLFLCIFARTKSLSFRSTRISTPPSSASLLRKLLLQQKELSAPAIALPGVHDALTAKIYAHAGAKALFLSGFGVSASRLGVPDAGILTRSEMEDTTRAVTTALSASRYTWMSSTPAPPPLIVDGDTGYGGTSNIRRTVRGMAAAGAAAISIEDQVFPKRCTFVAGKDVNVIPRQACLDRMKCALRARNEAIQHDGNDILVIARTDCRMALGLDEAVERCLAFQDMGADIVYAENLQSAEEYQHLRSAMGSETPMMLAQVQMDPSKQSSQKLFTVDEIGQLRYNLALFGVTALQATVGAIQATAQDFLDASKGGVVDGEKLGESSNALASFEEVQRVVGFPELMEFEDEYLCE